VDIGYVGDIKTIDTTLIKILLSNNFVPVVSTISSGEDDGEDYNVNADMFAGYLAGVLEVKHFIMLTDVDGLMKDPSESSSLIREIKVTEMEALYQDVIKGGMIPKTEACKTAIEFGAEAALIINGKKPERLLESLKESKDIQGTRFVK
jgi:acetylglutamate kinase